MTDQAPRQNHDGHPCPPWCVTDHGMPIAQAHWGATASIEVPGADRAPDRISARAVHLGTAGDRPEVSVATFRHGGKGGSPDLWLAPRSAEHLAGLVEMLASATPEQHGELAAGIREAAAELRGPEATEPEAG